jgi:(p)ppGpp synthase/HD superfamily hydrolase
MLGGGGDKEAILQEMLGDVAFVARTVAPGAEIQSRIKSVQSSLRRLRRVPVGRDPFLDSIGIRVIVHSKEECYAVIAGLHRRFQVLEEEFDDYVKRPKANGYRSLHTTLLASDGRPVEVQVRTRKMHAVAEQGGAAHRVYKQMVELTEAGRDRPRPRHEGSPGHGRPRSQSLGEDALQRWESEGGRIPGRR